MTRGGEIPGQARNDRERKARKDKQIPGQAGNDSSMGQAGNDGSITVSANNIHLESSFKVRKEDFERELEAIREQHPDSLVWNRSIDSLKREWATHNAFHAMGIFRDRTGHMDLNWPQPWFVRLGYALIGSIVWPFIK